MFVAASLPFSASARSALHIEVYYHLINRGLAASFLDFLLSLFFYHPPNFIQFYPTYGVRAVEV